MQKPTIIVSGKNGQLGNELQDISPAYPQFDFHFFGRDELDITDTVALEKIFQKFSPAYFVNAAGYTAVDKAETDQENAYLINAAAPGVIAKLCNSRNTKLIHISTDYVFDGKSNEPYKEDDATCPVNYYGFSKWTGEKLALENNQQTIIIRTSWVYSVYGNNFVKTMLRLMKERSSINVINDQWGSPTYAKDLAETILKIIDTGLQPPQIFHRGIYHYSNSGAISWFDFAKAIRDIKNFHCTVHPIPTQQYPTPAKRPAYAVMNKEKIQSILHIHLKNWKESLEECLNKL